MLEFEPGEVKENWGDWERSREPLAGRPAESKESISLCDSQPVPRGRRTETDEMSAIIVPFNQARGMIIHVDSDGAIV